MDLGNKEVLQKKISELAASMHPLASPGSLRCILICCFQMPISIIHFRRNPKSAAFVAVLPYDSSVSFQMPISRSSIEERLQIQARTPYQRPRVHSIHLKFPFKQVYYRLIGFRYFQATLPGHNPGTPPSVRLLALCSCNSHITKTKVKCKWIEMKSMKLLISVFTLLYQSIITSNPN